MVWLSGRSAGAVLAALAVSGARASSTQPYVCYRPFFSEGRLLRYMLPCEVMTTDLEGVFPLVTHHALDSGMLTIHLSCLADPDVCRKVETALDMVLIQVEYGVTFTAPVVVVMAFRPLTWGPRDSVAAPTREIMMVDQDGVERLYPQSLVKQFGVLGIEKLFEPIDIEINFNSEAEWAFPDECPEPRKIDFVGTAVLEILHGLGFASSWRCLGITGWHTYGVMPSMSFRSTRFPSGSVHFFDGFVELAMGRKEFSTAVQKMVSFFSRRGLSMFWALPDRLLVERGKRLLRERIDKVNTFKFSQSARNADLEFYVDSVHKAFEGSREFEQSVAVFNLANRNPGTIYLAVPGRFYLETSLEFTIDKSLYDVDEHMYRGTDDFLLFQPAYHRFPTCRITSRAIVSDRYLRVLSELGYHTRLSSPRPKPARFATAPRAASGGRPSPAVPAGGPAAWLKGNEADDVFLDWEDTWHFREW